MAQAKNLQKGDVLSEAQYYKVESKTATEVIVTTDSGEKIALPNGYVDAFLNSATQFDKTEKVSRTEMVEIMMKHPRVAMQATYFKQVKVEDVLKQVVDAHLNTAPKDFEKTAKAAIKKGMDGEERVITGRHYGLVDDFGRIKFIDMNIDGTAVAGGRDPRERLVDPRTLKELIVLNTKYIIK